MKIKASSHYRTLSLILARARRQVGCIWGGNQRVIGAPQSLCVNYTTMHQRASPTPNTYHVKYLDRSTIWTGRLTGHHVVSGVLTSYSQWKSTAWVEVTGRETTAATSLIRNASLLFWQHTDREDRAGHCWYKTRLLAFKFSHFKINSNNKYIFVALQCVVTDHCICNDWSSFHIYLMHEMNIRKCLN